VVSVDTGIVHLAGAMGAPVWTILPVSPDFRWMLDRTDSPWYPTMRLMRQDRVFHWEGLFPQIAEALEEYAGDPVAWHMREAERKFSAGDRDRAKVQLLAIAKRYPIDLRLINLLGKLLWMDGDTEHAVRAFLAAMQIDPFDRQTVLNCGDVMAALGQTADARMLYEGYLARRPNDVEFQMALDMLEPNGRIVARAA
jgi:Flp pilus assembly protein TadD